MASLAICADCGDEVLATQATAVVRASGVALICDGCSSARQERRPPPVARRAPSHPLLSATIAASEIPRLARAERAPIPESIAAVREPEDGDEDYDDITIEADEPAGDLAASEAVFEIAGEDAAADGDGPRNSAGLDRASASGAIDASPARGPRLDTTPPPAVVVGD